jgi:putative membrane protein
MSDEAGANSISSNDLAVDRTRLAHDRTLMAWVRTATSLISFGFTIYKFFQALPNAEAANEHRLFGPRRFAIFMIAIGIVSLAIATFQHIRDMRSLRSVYPKVPVSLASLLAGLIAALGVVALWAVIFRQ